MQTLLPTAISLAKRLNMRYNKFYGKVRFLVLPIRYNMFNDLADGGDLMARGVNQKIRLLYLMRIMLERTDDEHGLTLE